MGIRVSSTRRRFLRDTALAGAAAQFSTAKAAPSDRVHMGVIGLGTRGTHVMQAFQALPEVNIVAGADLYDGHLAYVRELSQGKIETGKDYRALLDRKDIDAVLIAT